MCNPKKPLPFMYIDTHAHLYLEDFKEDFDQILMRMHETKVSKVFLPNIDAGSVEKNLSLQRSHPGTFYSMLGLHPCSVNGDWQKQLDQIFRNGNTRICAIGEIGMDTYWDDTYVTEQEQAFRYQTDLSIERGLPIVIHCRETMDQIIEILSEPTYADAYGIFHCFSGTIEQAKKIIDLGYKLGIGGIVTFKNAGLDKILAEIDLEHMVLETDSPYLSPTPYRGKRNESAYIPLIAKKIAEIKNTDETTVAQITTSNALAVFSVQTP